MGIANSDSNRRKTTRHKTWLLKYINFSREGGQQWAQFPLVGYTSYAGRRRDI